MWACGEARWGEEESGTCVHVHVHVHVLRARGLWAVVVLLRPAPEIDPSSLTCMSGVRKVRLGALALSGLCYRVEAVRGHKRETGA